VLLHLTQREKKQIIHFPSLMFVRRIPYQSVRRRKIPQLAAAAWCAAALALIISAFARPLIQQSTGHRARRRRARSGGAARHQYSMGFADRWETGARGGAHPVSA
jgi:hypothetical protein